MDSEPESSLLAPSTTLDSTSAPSKRSRTALATWAHARTAENDEPEFKGRDRILYCIHCLPKSPYSSPITTNFRKHLNSKHPEIKVDKDLNQVQSATLDKLQQLYIQANALGQAEKINTQALQRVLNQDIIDKALVSLIVGENLSFWIIESPRFHAFCQVLNPESRDYIITSHSTVPKRINESWQAQKDIVRKIIQSAASSIHLSLDIWTSPNRYLLLRICAYFVEQSQEKLLKALLALPVVANHSREE